jgi:tetratricopeptide (TPR) repeat protein
MRASLLIGTILTLAFPLLSPGQALAVAVASAARQEAKAPPEAITQSERDAAEAAELRALFGREIYMELQAAEAAEAGDYRAAEQIWLILLAEAEAGESENSTVGGRRFSLAQVLLPQGRALEAASLFEQVVDEAREAGEDFELVEVGLAEAYFDLGRYVESAAILRPLYEGSQGVERMTYANNLARALDGAGRHEEATTLLRQVVAAARARDGQLFTSPHSLARNLFNLARTLAAQGQYGEAGRLFAESADLTVDRRPPGHTDIIAAHSFLARHKLLAEADATGALAAARTLSANLNAYLGDSTGGEIDRRQAIQNAGAPPDLFTLHVEAAWAVANGG